MASNDRARKEEAGKMPSQQFLLECFTYCPRTGILLWRTRPIGHFPSLRCCSIWNAKYPGRIAGCKKSKNKKYQLVAIAGFGILRGHRLIWKIMTGQEPERDIDHWDLDGFNNKWENLRDATRTQNMANIPVSDKNKIGIKRVYKVGRRYRSMISINNKSTHIGYFDTPEEAGDAYFNKAKELFGEFARAS